MEQVIEDLGRRVRKYAEIEKQLDAQIEECNLASKNRQKFYDQHHAIFATHEALRKIEGEALSKVFDLKTRRSAFVKKKEQVTSTLNGLLVALKDDDLDVMDGTVAGATTASQASTLSQTSVSSTDSVGLVREGTIVPVATKVATPAAATIVAPVTPSATVTPPSSSSSDVPEMKTPDTKRIKQASEEPATAPAASSSVVVMAAPPQKHVPTAQPLSFAVPAHSSSKQVLKQPSSSSSTNPPTVENDLELTEKFKQALMVYPGYDIVSDLNKKDKSLRVAIDPRIKDVVLRYIKSIMFNATSGSVITELMNADQVQATLWLEYKTPKTQYASRKCMLCELPIFMDKMDRTYTSPSCKEHILHAVCGIVARNLFQEPPNHCLGSRLSSGRCEEPQQDKPQ